ncbi:MAG: carotenoid biosynthesis protein [Anaerolineae bacterium]|nr:carotenoid biosynthesis protein [Anaerolineae bacterium]
MAALTVWLATLIATPISQWAGLQMFPLMATLGVMGQASATLAALSHNWSAERISAALMLISALTWLAEFSGTHTGFPFGNYHYTNALQPQLGHVPLLIPLAWFMMLPPAWGVVRLILPERAPGLPDRLRFAGLSALAFTAWDLYLDPQMTDRNLWRWQRSGAYFGIPLVNFLGWWLTAFLITWVLNPRDLPRHRLALIYSLTWWFQAVGLGIFWKRPGPALFGALGMGAFVWLAWRKEARRWRLCSSGR